MKSKRNITKAFYSGVTFISLYLMLCIYDMKVRPMASGSKGENDIHTRVIIHSLDGVGIWISYLLCSSYVFMSKFDNRYVSVYAQTK